MRQTTGPSDQLPKLLKVKEAASLLRVHPNQVYLDIQHDIYLPGTVLKFGGRYRLREDYLLEHIYRSALGESASIADNDASDDPSPPLPIKP